MKHFNCKLLAMASVFVFNSSIVDAQDKKGQLDACLDAGFSKLISAQSRDLLSPQYRVVCQYLEIKKRKRNDSFTYHAPDGFLIEDARITIVAKTSRSSVGELKYGKHRATINLQCHGDAENVENHSGVGINIVGRLVYQPTLEDTKAIASTCLNQILK